MPRCSVWTADHWRRVRTLAWASFTQWRRPLHAQPAVFLQLGYDLPELIVEGIRQHTRPIVYWGPEWIWPIYPLRLPYRISRIVGSDVATVAPTFAMPAMPELMTYEGVDLSTVCQPMLSQVLTHASTEMTRVLIESVVVLDYLKPAIILSSISLWREHLIQRLANPHTDWRTL